MSKIIEVTKEEEKLLHNKKAYKLKIVPGDRIYVTSNVDIKKRDVDAYLKNNFTDVKRVVYLKDANKIVDNYNYYNRYTCCTVDNKLEVTINGVVKWYNSTWGVYSQELADDLRGEISDKDYDSWVTVYNNSTWVTVSNLIKYYWDIAKSKRAICIDNTADCDNVVSKLLETPIYKSDQLINDVSNYINSTKVSSDSFSIDNVARLFFSGEETNTKLALKMIQSYDMRNYYSELLYIYFSGQINTNEQKLLAKYLRSQSLFRKCLPAVGSKQSDLFEEGFSNFRVLLSIVLQEGISINYDFITKNMFKDV